MAVCLTSIDKGHFLYTVSKSKYELLWYQSTKLWFKWSQTFLKHYKPSFSVMVFFLFLNFYLPLTPLHSSLLIIFSSYVVACISGYQNQWLIFAYITFCRIFLFTKTSLIFQNPYFLRLQCSTSVFIFSLPEHYIFLNFFKLFFWQVRAFGEHRIQHLKNHLNPHQHTRLLDSLKTQRAS